MDAATLARAMGCSRALADRYVGGFNQALVQAQCTTVNRSAMFCAQTGHESGGFKWLEEIASGAAYEGRRDLGNTQPGFGRRYKGRGIIQCTGAVNYRALSKWAHAQRLVSSPTYFYDNPHLVAQPPWAFISASWYWTVARGTRINDAADRRDITAATRLINGGTNGLADRRNRWNRCLSLGNALLPTGGSAARSEEDDELDAEQNRKLNELYMQLVQGTGKANEPRTWGWPGWAGGTGEHLTLIDMNRRLVVEVRQARNAIAKLQAELDQLKGR